MDLAVPGQLDRLRRRVPVPVLVAAVAFLGLYWTTLSALLWDWWNLPDAAHGLLLVPVAIWFAWRSGLIEDRAPRPGLGIGLLATAVLLRFGAELAGELFTVRLSLWLAVCGLVVFVWGLRQARHWWLPFAMLVLSVPLPEMLVGVLSHPLQLQASELGAAMLSWRDVPVVLSGNVIMLPGHSLFVTEACSGLRSLTALLALGVLISGLWLNRPWSRTALMFVAIPVAVLINGARVFLTGFLIFYVDPALGEGFMHLSEGLAMFVVAFVVLGGIAWLLAHVEGRFSGQPAGQPEGVL